MTDLLRRTLDNIGSIFKYHMNRGPINLILTALEKMTGLKREHIALYTVGILIIYLLFGRYQDFVCNLIGFIYPAFCSLLIPTFSVWEDDKYWLVYWIIYVTLNIVEHIEHKVVSNIFGYWLGKCIFLMWLMMSGNNSGTYIIYHHILKPLITLLSRNNNGFYNRTAGQSDDPNNSVVDEHGNPLGADYDLGRDGAFTKYSILIGQFYSDEAFNDAAMMKPINALKQKGFQVKHVKSENEFITDLNPDRYQIAWVISSLKIENSSIINCLAAFNSRGGAIFLFADNVPYISHASEFLKAKFNITLMGDFMGGKILTYKEKGNLEAGHFGQHHIFTGIKNLFEGVTICHPVYSTPNKPENFVTVATSTDGKPNITVFDPPRKSSEGRLCLDCGFTKLFVNWNDAGTARYIVNVNCWLTGIDRHR